MSQVTILESKSARKTLRKASVAIVKAYEVWCKLVEIHGVSVIKKFSGYQDEKLHGKWKDYRSSRLNKKWRIIYTCKTSNQVEIVTVEKVTAHDYRRK